MNEMLPVLYVNLIAVLVSVVASLFPVYWARKYNSDYRDGVRLLLPGLAQVITGSIVFGVMYAIQIVGFVDDIELQNVLRPATLLFLLSPFTMIVSLHFWKR
jgi:hypothetical protein